MIARIRIAIGSKGGTVGGKAFGIIAATAAEKVKKRETLSESEQRVYDVKVMGGKAASIPRQFRFWSTKGKKRNTFITFLTSSSLTNPVTVNVIEIPPKIRLYPVKKL